LIPLYFDWLILQLYQSPKIHFHWFFLVIILGFNNSTTSRFPNIMKPFQFQCHFLKFMTYTSHWNRFNFLLLLADSGIFLIYSWLFLKYPNFSVPNLLFLFHLRSPLSALCSHTSLLPSLSRDAPTLGQGNLILMNEIT